MPRLSYHMGIQTAAVAALALGASAASSAAAQGREQEVSRSCQDDNGVNRCSSEQQRRVLDLFGLKTIEEHDRAGDQVRRAFYVDGYGRDLVAIAFVRPRGGDPMVSVHYPTAGGERAPTATALVSREVWDEVLRRSTYFDRSFAPVAPASASDELAICLHSWVYTVEASDPRATPQGGSTIRRKVEDACDDGPGEVFASDLARLALPLLPYCAALDPQGHRNDASRLRACSMLRGDRIAAAAGYGVAAKLAWLNRESTEADARGIFAHDARLTWADGTTSRGNGAREWIARTTGENNANFYVARVTGEHSDRVRIDGELVRYSGENDQTRSRAPVSLMVTLGPGGSPLVAEGTLGPFVPDRD